MTTPPSNGGHGHGHGHGGIGRSAPIRIIGGGLAAGPPSSRIIGQRRLPTTTSTSSAVVASASAPPPSSSPSSSPVAVSPTTTTSAVARFATTGNDAVPCHPLAETAAAEQQRRPSSLYSEGAAGGVVGGGGGGGRYDVDRQSSHPRRQHRHESMIADDAYSSTAAAITAATTTTTTTARRTSTATESASSYRPRTPPPPPPPSHPSRQQQQTTTTMTTPTGGQQSSMSTTTSSSSPGSGPDASRHRRHESVDDEIDAFFLDPSSHSSSIENDHAGVSSSSSSSMTTTASPRRRHRHPIPPPDPSVPPLARCRSLASMRAWGDALRASNDALHGRDPAGDVRGIGACYAEWLMAIAATSEADPASASASPSSTTGATSSMLGAIDADGPRRDTCELISLRFVAQMKLRRHADAGTDVASLGLPLTWCAASAGGASDDGPLPPWVPFGLRMLAAHQLQYGDGSAGATDALYALRDRAVRTEYWNTRGMEIWRAAIDNALVNAHVRRREWRLALRSLDEMIGGLGIGVTREVEWWCGRTLGEDAASDVERSRMGEVVAAAARVELLSRQLLVLLQSGALSAADAIQEDARQHATEFDSLVSRPSPKTSNMTALARMIKESALTRQVPVRLWINEGLLLFARNKYTEAATCFRDALYRQRQLDPPTVASATLQSHPAGCQTWKDLTSPTLGFDAEPSLTVECLNNLSLCHLYSGNMQLAVQELEGLIRENPCLYLTEAVAFNLCTMYELGLDGEECARKKQLLHRIAKRFHLHDVSVESFRLG